MNYTKGPWKTEYDAVIQTWDVHPDYLNLIGYFARIYKKQNQSINEHAANARLIAAAPDLLEACKSGHEALKDILNASDNGHPYNDAELKREFNEICNQMHAAIAKAE